jgi:hypothetical protein
MLIFWTILRCHNIYCTLAATLKPGSNLCYVVLRGVEATEHTAVETPGFEIAYANARRTYSDQTWFSLTPSEQTSMIYQELRRLDREWALITSSATADQPDVLAQFA